MLTRIDETLMSCIQIIRDHDFDGIEIEHVHNSGNMQAPRTSPPTR